MSSSYITTTTSGIYIDHVDCAGISDIFYVTAIIIKELINKEEDKGRDNDEYYISTVDSLKQLITLSSDYGLSYAAENLYNSAQDLLNVFRYNHQIDHQLSILSSLPSPLQSSSSLSSSSDTSSSSRSSSIIDDSIIFRACVLTPGVFDSIEHIMTTRSILTTRILTLYNNIFSHHYHYRISHIDEFVLSPTFYFAYQGYNDRDLLSMLQESYIDTYPLLGRNEIIMNVMNNRYFYQHYNLIYNGNLNNNSVDINHNHSHHHSHSHQQQQEQHQQLSDQKQQQQQDGIYHKDDDDDHHHYTHNNDDQYIDPNQSPSATISDPTSTLILTSTSISISTFPQQLIIEDRVRKIRIGFVSSYYRRHSICKLFCGKIIIMMMLLF